MATTIAPRARRYIIGGRTTACLRLESLTTLTNPIVPVPSSQLWSRRHLAHATAASSHTNLARIASRRSELHPIARLSGLKLTQPHRSPLSLGPLRSFTVHASRKAAPPERPADVTSSSDHGATNTTTTTANTSDPAPPPPSRSRARLFAAICLLLGVALGGAVRMALHPPVPPVPGSPEDEELCSILAKRAAALPIIKTLSSDPNYESWDAYTGYTAQQTTARLTSGTLAGIRGIPYQRIFRHRTEGHCISVVYFGAGTCGWPGVVHGGALATILDESIGRVAIRFFPARAAVTANLDLHYRAPTRADNFYIVRAQPVPLAEGEDPAKRERKMWVTGSVETLDGKKCVDAKGLFVVPKGVILPKAPETF